MYGLKCVPGLCRTHDTHTHTRHTHTHTPRTHTYTHGSSFGTCMSGVMWGHMCSYRLAHVCVCVCVCVSVDGPTCCMSAGLWWYFRHLELSFSYRVRAALHRTHTRQHSTRGHRTHAAYRQPCFVSFLYTTLCTLKQAHPVASDRVCMAEQQHARLVPFKGR